MKCYNCGAQIQEASLICPYCGAEQEELAKKEQQEILDDYQRKTEDLKHIPGRVVNKTSRYLVTGAAGLFLLFVLGVLISWLVSGWTAESALDRQNKQLEQLEEYYMAGDYETMASVLEDTDVRGATFRKYELVAGFYDSMEWRIEAIKNERDFIEDLGLEAEDVAETLAYSIEELVQMKELEDNGFAYGEETGILFIRTCYMDVLQTYMLLTEEEILEAVSQYEDSTSCVELAEKALERIKQE